MNKSSKKAAKPLSENARRAIIITAIIVVAVIVLSVALSLVLRPEQITPSENDPGSTGSSSLTIRNGDFFYTGSDDTAYPRTAQNWSKYAYKAVQGSSHDFETIATSEKVVMGIVTTATEGDGDTWATVSEDLATESITATNPGKHSDDLEDDKVYMIATKEPTTASILSDSFSVSSSKSVKIGVWINTAQIAEDSHAVIMLQKSTVSAKEENWYAYNFQVEKSDINSDNHGWEHYEFYIFNRETSTKYIRLSVGLGNVYSGEEGLDLVGEEKNEPINGSGILFVDDITYEEVTANEYRTTVDAEGAEDSTAFKIIENEDIEDESTYLGWDVLEDGQFEGTYATSEQFAEEAEYSPFTNRDDFFRREKTSENSDETNEGEGQAPERKASGFTIYKLGHNGDATTTPIGVRLQSTPDNLVGDPIQAAGTNGGINTLYSLWQKDHHHVSFWVRVEQLENNKVAKANIYVQSWDTEKGEWTDIDSGSWTSIVTSQDIETDSNAGWIKYDVYLKPAAEEKEISILVTLGSKDGNYTEQQQENGLYPNGTLYVTSPSYERISSKDYNNASSGSYSKKLDLIGSSATTSVTNGTFSSLNNTSTQPSSWTPVFAGDNMLYRDGRNDDVITLPGSTEENPLVLSRKSSDTEGSQVLRGYTDGSHGYDDEQHNVLLIKNNVSTSFGYISENITLSPKTLYVASVLTKGNGGHFYLLNTDTTLERADRLIGEGQAVTANEKALGQSVGKEKLANDWTRHYIVVLTGDQSQTVRIALFNGKLDGSELNQGDVYFDQVELKTLGSYATADDPDWEEDQENKKYIVNWTMSNYQLDGEAIKVQDFLPQAAVTELVNAGALKLEDGETAVDGTFASLIKSRPSTDDWNTMLTVPEEEAAEEEPEEPAEEEAASDIDLGLLFSVISSVALVAALLVVVVVKFFRNRKNQKKAA